MPSRAVSIDGETWQVFPSGYITQYTADEFGLVFRRGTGDDTEIRVTRYSPRGTASREASLAEFSDDELRRLFVHSQPAATSPEAGYRA